MKKSKPAPGGCALGAKKLLLVLWLIWGMAISQQAWAEEGCTCPCDCDPPEETPVYSTAIAINEFLPNPSGEEEAGEWIELYNSGTEDVDLCGWQMKDSTDNVYTIEAADYESTLIKAGNYFVINRSISSIALNNTGGDEVNLYQPDGNLLQTIKYTETATEDLSYAQDKDSNWQWTSSLTPGAANAFPEADNEDEEETAPPPEETPEETPQEPPIDSPETKIEYSDQIVISEIYANPKDGEIEFIELKNKSETAVDLNGWKISDNTDKEFIITADDYSNTKIEKYFVIYGDVSKIALNNDGDQVELYQPDGTMLDKIVFEKGTKGQSYNLKEGEWQWSDIITPNADNKIQVSSQEEKKSEDTNTSSPNESKENETKIDYSDKLQISELLPDPEGSDSTDEFIEIYNGDEQNVNLKGWSLSDNSKKFIWPEDLQIKAHAYMAFYITDTKISLNNSGETITLSNPEEEVVYTIYYSQAKTGQSYILNGETWSWTTEITPNESNILVELETGEVEEEEAVEKEKEEAKDDYASLTIQEAREASKDSLAQIIGVVTVLPGILGTQYFYIQDETSGLQVYSSKKDFPELAIGDSVQVRGKLSEANSETKINISSSADIEVLDHDKSFEPEEVESLSEAEEGKLVITTSPILDWSSNKITLVNGITVYIKDSVEINKKDYAEGDTITVIGIAGQYKEEYRLLPRSAEDFEKIEAASDVSSGGLIKTAYAQDVGSSSTLLNANDNSTKIIRYLTLSLAIIILTMIGIIYKTGVYKEWREKLANFWAGARKKTTVKDDQNQYHV